MRTIARVRSKYASALATSGSGDNSAISPATRLISASFAARLEGVAKPGAICLSEDAYRQVKARFDLKVSDLGEVQLNSRELSQQPWVRLLHSGGFRPRQGIKVVPALARAAIRTGKCFHLWRLWLGIHRAHLVLRAQILDQERDLLVAVAASTQVGLDLLDGAAEKRRYWPLFDRSWSLLLILPHRPQFAVDCVLGPTAGGIAVAIYRLLQNAVFGPEDIQRLSTAYEDARSALWN